MQEPQGSSQDTWGSREHKYRCQQPCCKLFEIFPNIVLVAIVKDTIDGSDVEGSDLVVVLASWYPDSDMSATSSTWPQSWSWTV